MRQTEITERIEAIKKELTGLGDLRPGSLCKQKRGATGEEDIVMKTEQQVPEINLEELPKDVDTCHALIKELAEAMGREQVLNEHLQHQLEQLLKHRFGRRADQVDPGQLMSLAAFAQGFPPHAQNLPMEGP